ncbi:MAG: N-acetylmuramoyl-L-alanine amidase [Firmicutes bacterium]|nr:N-acetylmuramoyl-L-alanine amidase [Bacillota bacterium]
MARIYLAPSLQPWNQSVLGVSEQFLMNLIADACEPLLRLNGISFQRNRIGMTLSQYIAEANAGAFDIYVAIHSNAAPVAGTARGSRHYFFATSTEGQRLAENMVTEFKKIYHDPSRVVTVPNTTLLELRATKMPAVSVETAFHDNPIDAEWIRDNIQNIAQAIVRGIVTYFGRHYIEPCTHGTTSAMMHKCTRFRWARVCTGGAGLNIRNGPDGDVIFSVPDRTQLIIIGPTRNGWVPVRFNMREGFASAQFICICNEDDAIRPEPPIGIIPPIVTPVPPIAPIPPVMPPIGTFPPITPPIGIIPPLPPVPPPPLYVCGPTPTMACMGVVRTQSGNLNMRNMPSMNGVIIDKIPNGSRILLLGEEGNWWYVFFNHKFGWVSKDFVEQERRV